MSVKIDVIKTKLESLEKCLKRIKEKTPDSASELEQDIDAQDIIVVNLERLIQICIDIGSHILAAENLASPDTMAKVFLNLGTAGIINNNLADEMARAAAFRNLAVHQYSDLNWEHVYTIISTRLDDFKDFAKEILAYTRKTAP